MGQHNLVEVVVGFCNAVRGRVASLGRTRAILVLVLALLLGGVLAQDGAGAAARPAKVAGVASTATTTSTTATGLPSGFQESVVFSGLTQPTAIRFSPDGRIFVAEKSGIIKVFDSLTDTTPTVFADLSTNVYNFWDRGLLGLALDPNFPTNPYVYVLYTYDAEIGQQAPKFGTPGVLSDPCPNPPGATADGCVVSGRLSRLQANGDVMTGSEQVLINDWCQQYPSLSVGSLVFGQDGALYASAGTASSFTFDDWGQDGNPLNPCGDPPGGVGATLTPPTAEGGSLRAQDVRTTGDPTGLDGTIIRIDPATGDAPLNNPLATSSDPNTRRIVAYGARNPFRMTLRPGTNELWFGDVGTGNYEELNRIVSPTDALVENFGWPCYEGPNKEPGFAVAGLALCDSLYAAGSPPAGGTPYFSYAHSNGTYAGDPCPTGSSSISGEAFYTGSSYPAQYQGGLFFADYSRNCIWFAQKGSNGLPDMSTTTAFAVGAAGPVDLETGPNGDLFYTDFTNGTIRRIQYTGAVPPPPTGTDYLSDLTWTSATNGWGPVEKDMSNGGLAAGDGHTITLNGTTYAKGLGTNSVSDIRYALSGGCSRFRADVGVDDEITSTRASVVFQVFADGTKLYDSGVMGATTATKSIDVDLTGRNELQLVVGDAGDGNDSDHGDWAAARIDCGNGSSPPPPSGTNYLSDLTWTSATNGWGPVEKDMSNGGLAAGDGHTITLNGTTYAKGLGTNAVSDIRYSLGGACTRFRADVGVDDEITSTRASVVFQVFADGTKLYDSGVMGATTATKSIDVDLTGKSQLQLVVGDAGDGNDSDHGDWAAARIDCGSPNTPPTPTITAPPAGTTWKVGDVINFSGSATDAEDGTLPASRLSWTLILHHCPSNCHTHIVQTWTGVSSGSFTAPDHEYPSYLELQLTATDSGGASTTTSVELDPQSVTLTFQSSPSGLQLVVNGVPGTTPFTRTVITGSTNTISAGSPQTLNGTTYAFSSWSDGGAASHNITANTSSTYTATYTAQQQTPTVVSLTFDDGWDNQSQAASMLAAHSLNGTFYVNTPKIGQAGYLTWAQLDSFAAAGNEIGGHTLTHPDLTTLTSTDAQHEVCDDRANLVSHGFSPASFAYPGGAYDSTTGSGSLDVSSIVQSCGYASGRGAFGLHSITDSTDTRPFSTSIPPPNPLKIKTPCCINTASFGGSSPTAAALESYVTNAKNAGGGWVPFVFHRICDSCGGDSPAPSMSPTQFQAFLDWLQSNNVVVRTVGQVIKNDTQPPTTAISCGGAACSTGWYTSPVSVSLFATDSGSAGVAIVRYTTDGSDPVPSSPAYTAPFTVSATTTVKFRAWDTAGNVESTKSQLVKVDSAPPTSSIACNGSACSGSAYGSAVSVTLSATDGTGGSGVAAIRYTLDGSDPTASSTLYSGAFSVSTTTTVKFRAWDVAGNVEPVNSQLVQVVAADTTAPTTSISCNGTTCSTGWYAASVSVALAATDAGGSGVDVIRYTLDGTDPTTSSTAYIGPFFVAATTTVKYRAWDKAGNVEATKSQLIRIDTTAPTVAVTSPANGATVTGTIKVTASASDGGSGVASVSFYVDGVLIGTKTGTPFTVSWNTKKVAAGQHTLTAVARDVAGNQQTSAAITVTVR